VLAKGIAKQQQLCQRISRANPKNHKSKAKLSFSQFQLQTAILSNLHLYLRSAPNPRKSAVKNGFAFPPSFPPLPPFLRVQRFWFLVALGCVVSFVVKVSLCVLSALEFTLSGSERGE
jgi:hypothetical protein